MKTMGFGFVDDTNLVTLAPSVSCSAESLIPSFQCTLDRWSGCLVTTGGELAPVKSFCYLIDYAWTGTSWDYCCLPDVAGDITLTDNHQTCFLLCCFDVSHAEKKLWAFLSPWMAMSLLNSLTLGTTQWSLVYKSLMLHVLKPRHSTPSIPHS